MKKRFLIPIAVISILCIFYYANEARRYVKPTVTRIDITSIIQNGIISDEDYKTLFYQTGLGKVAVDEILKDKDGLEKMLKFQDDFLTTPNIKCESIIPLITNQESIVDENGNYKDGFNLAPYKNGYILITKATHTFTYRHGHAAIVVDEKNGTTLESIKLGTNSQFQNIESWKEYPSFIMLKPKDIDDEKMAQIASFAKENLNDVPYRITTGLFKKFVPVDDLKATQCSHLAWYPYKQFGYDLDSDGSWLVTAKDIANSPLLEVVQIYGVNPNDIW